MNPITSHPRRPRLPRFRRPTLAEWVLIALGLGQLVAAWGGWLLPLTGR